MPLANFASVMTTVDATYVDDMPRSIGSFKQPILVMSFSKHMTVLYSPSTGDSHFIGLV